MYGLLAERLPGAAVISIAHRPEAVALHERQLVIDPARHRLIDGATAVGEGRAWTEQAPF